MKFDAAGAPPFTFGGQAGRPRELGREDDAAANPARTQVIQRLLSGVERSCLDRDRLDSAGARKNEQFLQLRQRAHGHAYYADAAKRQCGERNVNRAAEQADDINAPSLAQQGEAEPGRTLRANEVDCGRKAARFLQQALADIGISGIDRRRSAGVEGDLRFVASTSATVGPTP